ncbi:DsrE family protein [Christiangramia sp. SM2212]|uniref:DsrE family protein n=1 Tax=Christiangramia sediminicola TaxID=3073267 RepID=A0ABU1ENS2_9FLAO|nr:DsrE family protein [Christiangramia sp. SM2212]MDR5589808.1 DsrE family protein [Christiangramia sp. SM2212]
MSLNLLAQDKPVQIVFDVTSDDARVHQKAVKHVKMMSKAYPDSDFEIVVYSGAIDMVVNDKSSVAEDLKMLAENERVTIAVCSATMARDNIDKSALIPGVTVVPDGILEIAQKQVKGWSYIKEQ